MSSLKVFAPLCTAFIAFGAFIAILSFTINMHLRPLEIEFKTELNEVKIEFKTELNEVKTEFKTELNEVKAELTELKGDIKSINSKLDKILMNSTK